MGTITFTSSGTWPVPADVLTVTVQCWGQGGNGHTCGATGAAGGGGGGGGYSTDVITVTPLSTLTITIDGTSSRVIGGSSTPTAGAGGSASTNAGGSGGTGDTHNGGGGGSGGGASNEGGGGGGGGAGSTGDGGTGGNFSGIAGGSGGSAGTGTGGAAGGGGAESGVSGAIGGSNPGGGGGGGASHTGNNPGAGGGTGQVTLTWTLTDGPKGYAGAIASTRGISGRIGGYKGYAGALWSSPQVVNTWAADFAQPTAGPVPPGLQSVVIPLNSSTSVLTSGSGISTSGNWLFAMVGWQQSPQQPANTFGVGDDVHSFWRPQAPSTASANSRTVIWYTPNIARQVNTVYIAPNAAPAGVSVLVVEVAGLGPWDSVISGLPSPAGYTTGYAAAATTLPLSLGTPSGNVFILGAVTGDNDTATTAFAPAGWTALPTVTATDGSDHLCDAVLTSAWVNTNTSVSVSGTAGSAEDLSGALVSVLWTAPSPVQGTNKNWPLTKLELGFGSGFQTPLEQVTWTDLTSRALRWEETTGVQYQLGQILSTDLTFELDNYDYALTPTNVNSPYYPNITTGTPIRMRFALGTIGGVIVNRWYVIHRNVLEWPEEITPALRPIVTGEGTDGWFDLSNTTNTPYRNEVYWDSPYAWWPCDDQPLAYGVLPTVLLNAANGNTSPLSIQVSPNGATLQTTYSTTGTSLSSLTRTSNTAPAHAVAIYSVGASVGWMFGDPQSLFNNNIAAGGQATSNPGSAAWQASEQAGNTGSYGWFLYCNDNNFPSLLNGITVEGWFNCEFFGSAQAEFQDSGSHLYDIAGQPYSAITLLELAGTPATLLPNPIIKLQLDLSGHLNLLTFNGASSTSQPIYSTSDLRAQTWFHVAIELTTSTYLVYVNGGLTAAVSGAATINPGFTWLIVNGDLGANGGSTAGTGLVNGGNIQVSHLAVYPVLLPAWRILAHYWAAITGNGLIPAPQSPQVQAVQMTSAASLSEDTALEFTPDGSGTDAAGAGYGQVGSAVGDNVVYSFSLVVVAVAGSYMSGPSAWTNAIGIGFSDTSNANTVGQYVFTSWTGTAAKFNVYTSSAVNAETEAVVLVANSDSFSSGFGSSAVSAGPGKIAAGDNSSPPANPSAIGDDVGQRMERILQQGLYTVPLRAVDPSPLLVQAPGANGAGLSTGAYLQAIQTSDDGMLFIDNLGYLTYWQKSHLASQYGSPAWTITPNAPPTPGAAATAIPYYREVKWILDPHRVWNAITIQPFDPNSAQLPVYTPSNSAGVLASQKQYGPQPLQVVSWLQSQTEMQTQANWLFANFGQPQRRSENVQIEAAAYPAAWNLVVGVNVGDIVQMQDWSIGNTGPVYTYRVTKIHRTFSYGSKGDEVRAAVNLQLDWEPPSYWS